MTDIQALLQKAAEICREEALNDIAEELEAAAKATGEPVAEVTGGSMIDVKFFENTEFGTELAPGTKLYLAPPAPAVPEGWKLVPVEPTEAMLEAERTANRGKVYFQDMTIGPKAMARDRYKAMLAAAGDSPHE